MVKKFYNDFKIFLKEYKVITVAVAFIMGAATNDLVKSFVNNIFMPLINPLLPEGGWETAALNIGPISLGWGPFLSSLLNFVLLGLIIFLVVKKLMKK